MSDANGVLGSVTVIDLTELLPGPNASRLLAALGANVIKVERPGGGDRLRARPGMFDSQNQGKRSIGLDLKSPRGREVLLRLVESAHIFMESYRPGVLDKLGLGYDDLHAVNPGLIYVSLSGYGEDGPYRDLPGHDFQYLAYAAAIPAPPADLAAQYTPTSAPVADMGGSLYATLGVVLALLDRQRSPETFRGCHIDLALADCALSIMEPRIAEASAEQTGGPAPLQRPAYGVYRTLDGRFISLGALEDHFFTRLMTAVNLPQFCAPEYADYHDRRRRYDEIEGALRPVLESYDRDALVELLTRHDVPVAPLNDLLEPLDDPGYRFRGMVYDDDAGSHPSAWPTALADFADRARLTPAPAIGGDSRTILAEHGYDAISVADLVSSGVVAAPD